MTQSVPTAIYISIYNLKYKKCADCAAFEVNCLIIKYKWAAWLVVNLAQTLPPVLFINKTDCYFIHSADYEALLL